MLHPLTVCVQVQSAAVCTAEGSLTSLSGVIRAEWACQSRADAELTACSRTKRSSRKDTRRSFSAAHQVEAGSDDVGGLAATRQALVEGHLVEVEGRVQTVLVHLQLMTQSVDVLLG